MKIIIDVASGSRPDIEDVKEFVQAVQRAAERRQWQGGAGALLEFGPEAIVVKSITFDGGL